MKSLIILAAFVVLARAADSDAKPDWKACKAEAQGFKQCIHEEITKTKQEAFAQLKKDLTQACFQNTVCKFPEFPPHHEGEHPKGLPAGNPPTPPPFVAQCFSGAKAAFVGCIKKQLNIPDNSNFGSEHQRPPHRPPFFHGHPNVSAAHDEIHQIALRACNNDEGAAKALEDCGKKFFTEKFKNHQKGHNPQIAAACKAAASCKDKHPFSAGCIELFKNGRKAFCDCKDEFPKFLKSSDSCAEVRSQFKAHAKNGAPNFAHDAGHNVTHEHVASASDHVHDFPHDHAVPFDFCNSNGASPFEVCKKVLAGDH